MKLILIISFLISLSIFSQNEKRTLNFDKNDQGGFNFYNFNGELLFEANKSNTDSSILQKLTDAFIKADIKDRIEIPIINLQEKGFDWTGVLIAFTGIIGAILGGYFANRWNSKSQENQYLLQQRIENKKEWLNNFRDKSSIFIAKLFYMNMLHNRYKHYKSSTDELGKNKFESAKKMLINNTTLIENVNRAMNDFTFSLNLTDEEHSNINKISITIADKLNKVESVSDETNRLKEMCYSVILKAEKELFN